MIFQKFTKRDDGWVIIDYSATWKYGYDFVLDAAQGILDNDLKNNIQRIAVAEVAGEEQKNVTSAVREAGDSLRKCPETEKECGMLTVAGISGIMQVPVQFVFFNQTNLVRVISPIIKYFEDNGEHVFDNYLNSVEIQAHCQATERRVRRELGREG